MVVTSFEFHDMQILFPNEATAVLTYRVKQAVAPRGKNTRLLQETHDSSTWVRSGSEWKCVIHTETPVEAKPKKTDRLKST